MIQATGKLPGPFLLHHKNMPDEKKSYYIGKVTRKTYEYLGIYLATTVMEKWVLSFGNSMSTVGFLHSNNHYSKYEATNTISKKSHSDHAHNHTMDHCYSLILPDYRLSESCFSNNHYNLFRSCNSLVCTAIADLFVTCAAAMIIFLTTYASKMHLHSGHPRLLLWTALIAVEIASLCGFIAFN
uniref:Uncharacterized protein n=1 Tax=Trichobilharzia regenti TaxID=157069 RepID=A0AA85J709_TRIRE|nr:unnamed protein product [Trichobilharzia regenti]